MPLDFRVTLAAGLRDSGNFEGALAVLNGALEECLTTLPPNNALRIQVQRYLGDVLIELGDHLQADRVLRTALDSLEGEREAPPLLQATLRTDRATALLGLGDLDLALELEESALEAVEGRLPADHQLVLNVKLGILACLARDEESRGQALALLRELFDQYRSQIEGEALHLSPRELEARAAALVRRVRPIVGFALLLDPEQGEPGLWEACFGLLESSRGAAETGARLRRSVAGSAETAALHAQLLELGARVAALSQSGGDREALRAGVAQRDAVERRLLAWARAAGVALPALDPSVLAAELPDDQAAVLYWRYEHVFPSFQEGGAIYTDPALLAFVLAPGRPLAVVDLGLLAPIERAAEAWQAALEEEGRPGATFAELLELTRRGQELRRLVIDPLAPYLEDARRLAVLPDDVLQDLPLAELPLGDDPDLPIEYRWRMHERESLHPLRPRSDPGSGTLLAFGDPRPPGGAPPGGRRGEASDTVGSRTGFGDGIRSVILKWKSTSEIPPLELTGARATRANLERFAPRARILHFALHGFAENEPLPAVLGPVLELAEVVAALSPHDRCGLVLADGRFTGSEVAVLPLEGCDLAVISACDTASGPRLPGQSRASLQRALQMAGVRSVIAARWAVNDAWATRLMEVFYEQYFVHGRRADDALWAAKDVLRRERAPRMETAAWVLVGAPD